MTDSPVVIIKKKAQPVENLREFTFSPSLEGLTGPILAYYQKAWAAYHSLKFPLRSDEAWRRTDIKDLAIETFSIGQESEQLSIPVSLLDPLTDTSHGGQIILTPKGSQISLDKQLHDQGVIFTDLATAFSQHSGLVKKILGKIIGLEENKFGSLAAAMAKSGTFLYVPKNVKISTPLHSLFWASGERSAFFTHYLIYLEEGAEVTYVHESSSPKDSAEQSMHSGLMEIFVGQNAKLTFVELQSWGENIWNFTHERINVERDGSVDWIFGALGSHLTKNFSDLNLVGEGSSGKVSGFYFTEGKQHLDHDTQQNHLAPHTTSDLLFKGALIGESRSVWQGMIYVAPNASKTDGYQANRNLILDRRSKADSIPGLEILTDDVRCTHGATVGKIDQEQVYYLESRGLPRTDAERLIVEGFFDPIMQRIPFEGVKNRFQRAIIEKLNDFHLENA
ncbi:MAG: Fe-S cluster assembly protein SufD [Anaerolineaceae bacterium]